MSIDSSALGETKCINWPGAKDKDGYGFVKILGKQKRAHRVALEKKLGRELKEGEQAMHLCNNPSCVNPEHLAPGSNKENQHHRRSTSKSLAISVLGVNPYTGDGTCSSIGVSGVCPERIEK